MSQDAIDKNFFDSEYEQKKVNDEKEIRQEWLKLLDDMRWILSTPKGRRVIWWLLGIAGVFRISFAPKDSNQTSFNEGSRDIGLRLLRVVQSANPKAYSQMEDEVIAKNGKKEKGDQSHV